MPSAILSRNEKGLAGVIRSSPRSLSAARAAHHVARNSDSISSAAASDSRYVRLPRKANGTTIGERR